MSKKSSPFLVLVIGIVTADPLACVFPALECEPFLRPSRIVGAEEVDCAVDAS